MGPIGNPDADYIRGRLKKRVMMELGITMTRREMSPLIQCLDKTATFANIFNLHEEALVETQDPTWQLEMEPLLVEVHGEWRYEGRPEVLAADMEKAYQRYLVMHTMDALLTACGFHTVRSRAERMDDAAWFAVKPSERI